MKSTEGNHCLHCPEQEAGHNHSASGVALTFLERPRAPWISGRDPPAPEIAAHVAPLPGISDVACRVPPKRGSRQARTAPECAQLLPRERQATRGTPEDEAQAAGWEERPVSALSGRAGRGPPPNSPVISERYLCARASVSAMQEKRERVIDRINAPVLGAAKRVLNEFQDKGGYSSQGDALSDLLLDYERLQERVKELEAQLVETRKN